MRLGRSLASLAIALDQAGPLGRRSWRQGAERPALPARLEFLEAQLHGQGLGPVVDGHESLDLDEELEPADRLRVVALDAEARELRVVELDEKLLGASAKLGSCGGVVAEDAVEQLGELVAALGGEPSLERLAVEEARLEVWVKESEPARSAPASTWFPVEEALVGETSHQAADGLPRDGAAIPAAVSDRGAKRSSEVLGGELDPGPKACRGDVKEDEIGALLDGPKGGQKVLEELSDLGFVEQERRPEVEPVARSGSLGAGGLVKDLEGPFCLERLEALQDASG